MVLQPHVLSLLVLASLLGITAAADPMTHQESGGVKIPDRNPHIIDGRICGAESMSHHAHVSDANRQCRVQLTMFCW